MRARKIATFGDVNVDWKIDVESIDEPIGTLSRESTRAISASLGGGGAIFSIAAKEAGFDSILFGKVGNDVLGRYAREYLADRGVHSSLAIDATYDTGKVLILRDAEDRRAMVSHRGANVQLQWSEVDGDLLRSADALYISGYALLERPQSETALEAARLAKESNKTVILDVVPHRIFSTGAGPDYRKALSMVDGIVLELGTAQRLFELPGAGEEEVIKRALDSYRWVVLRPNNDVQICASRDRVETTDTHYSTAKDRVGFLDKLIARTLFKLLGATYPPPAQIKTSPEAGPALG